MTNPSEVRKAENLSYATASAEARGSKTRYIISYMTPRGEVTLKPIKGMEKALKEIEEILEIPNGITEVKMVKKVQINADDLAYASRVRAEVNNPAAAASRAMAEEGE